MNNDKIWIKEIVADKYGECVPVDWTFSQEEAESKMGDYYKYSLEEGVECIIDMFDDYEFLGVYDNAYDFAKALVKFENEHDVEVVDCIDHFYDGKEYAFIIQWFDDSVTVHKFEEFNSLLGFNMNLYLYSILTKEAWENPWREMSWFLNLSVDEEEVIIDMWRKGFTVECLISPKFFCCLRE